MSIKFKEVKMTKQLKSLTILDKDYISWIDKLSSRYRKSQIKASIKVNTEMLRFYYDLGKDIVTLKAESK